MGIGAVRRNAARAVALSTVAVLFFAARLPVLSASDQAALASRYAFTKHRLQEPAGVEYRRRRAVNPAFARHVQWTSGLGAAVALADLDGDGLPNDVCLVDPRTDLVTIAPAPTTGTRFALFSLDAPVAGYDSTTVAPTGCLPADMNEDGRMDVLVYYWGRTPVLFLRRPGVGELGAAAFVARELVDPGERWYTTAAAFADLDGDGHLDLVLGNYFPDGARVLDEGATAADPMHDSWSRAYNGGRDRVFRWTSATDGGDPRVRFTESAGVFGGRLDRQWTLAIGAADLDGDHRPEIYLANDFGPDRLFHNRSSRGEIVLAPLDGRKTLTTPNSKVLGRDSFKGMGVDFADVNADGWLDMFVSNIAEEYALQESHFLWTSTGDVERMREGVAPYVDRSEALGLSRSGWGWETRFGDFDNDGEVEALQATGWFKGAINRWPELQELATVNDELIRWAGAWPRFREGDDVSGHEHNPFFVRAADGRYYDLAPAVGIDDVQVTRGIATADIDGDGDLDFAVANQWEPSALYRNEAPKPGSFLGLHLLLPIGAAASDDAVVRPGHPAPHAPARPAVGAAAVVHAGRRTLVAQVDGGNGHSGVRSSDLHFGLGTWPASRKVAVDLSWRDGTGRLHEARLAVRPGWHTVELGTSASEVARP